MKVVFVKNNEYIEYENFVIDGYKFNPRRKNIDSLIIVNNDMIKYILNKKLSRDIKRIDKTIKLIINSNVTLIDDCNMMEDELIRIIGLIIDKYLKYFDEFEFFEYIKSIYVLNMAIDLKKKMIDGAI